MNGFVSGYYKFAVWVTRLAYLNILWVAFTIVGLGLFGLMPSTMAMFAVARKWVMGERDIPIFKTFWDTYKKDFVKTNGIGLIIFTAIYILVIEFRILFNHEQLIYNLAAFGVVAIAILLAIVLTYIFPIYVHFNLRVRDYFTWPLVIGITHPILTVVLTVGIGALYYIVYNIIPVIVFLFGGSVAAYLLTLGGQQVFYKYEARDDDDDEDEARDDDEMEAITEVTEEN